jgi:eukaryotic-like serine/threonine-protein kinase
MEGGHLKSQADHDSPTLGPSPVKVSEAQAVGWPVQNWDRYRYEAYIGEGGMGRVFKAYDPQLKRHVALKFIRGDDPSLKERFLREAQGQASVVHENVCKIFDAGEVNGRFYISMQYIDGFTINRIPHEFSIEQKVKLMKEVAEGIHAAHRVGLIHRDVKPGNIMVEKTEDGGFLPYIMDFGLVRAAEAKGITMTGIIIGTPGYMAPEQAWNDDKHPLDRRADIYSLGATLYELISGRPPYDGTSSIEIIKHMVEKDPISLHQRMPNVPSELETIVMKCLEREPHRRYDSARAFAEDLGRFLDGEPILARRSTISYRLLKKARKHKAMTATVALFTVALIALLGFAIQSRLQAAKQAESAQRFGMEVERIEGILSRIHTLPIHDIRPELQNVRGKIKWIGQQMHETGSAAEGPGLHAIGRIHLGLHEYVKADEALQRAWDRGYRSPEVSYSLGLTLGHLYQSELKRVEQVSNKDDREAKRKEIETKYRDPAVRYLKQSHGAAFETPAYAEALIFYYEKKYDEALKKTMTAFNEISWMYEAKILEGDIYRSKANEESDTGKPDEALADFGKAEKAYQKAILIGRSDPNAYQGLCSLYVNRLHMDMYRGVDVAPLVPEGLDACGKVSQINTNLPEPYNSRSAVYRFMGEYQLINGTDPQKALESSAKEAEQAIQLDSKNSEAYGKLGTAYSLLGEYQSVLDQSPESFFLKSKAAFEKAVELMPRDPYPFHNLAVNYSILGTYKKNHGIEARADFEKIIYYESKATEINPKHVFAINGLGMGYSNLGNLDVESGKDPRANLEKSISYFKKVSELNSTSPYAYNNLSSVTQSLAEWEYDHGIDAVARYNEALKPAEQALKLAADYPFAHFNAAKILAGLARIEFNHNRSPENYLERSKTMLEKGIKIQSNIAGPNDELASVLLIEAEYEITQGKSPEHTIRETEPLIERSLKLGPTRSAAYIVRGDANVLLARWLMKNKRDAGSVLQKAHQAYEQAAKNNPRDRKAFIGLARTYLLFARSASSIDQRNNFAKQGIAAADQALSITPDTAIAFAIKGKLLELKQDSAAAAQAIQQASKINKSLNVETF